VVFDSDSETAYVTTSKGHLSAVTLDGDSGTAKWTFPDPDRDSDDKFKTRAIYGAPVVEDDRVYLATFAGGVFALNKDDGRPVWPGSNGNAGKIDGNLAGGVAVSDENVYFGTTEGRLYAWKKSDGTPAAGWEQPKKFEGGIWATPIVHGDTLYVATMKGKLYALSLADGSERWAPFESSAAIPDLSLVDDDTLFAASINRHAYLISAKDGSQIADFEAGNWLWTAPAAKDSKLFFGDFGGSIYGLNITSSGVQQLWEPASTDAERIRSGPVVIGNVLVVADRKPVIWFFDVNTGQPLNHVPWPDVGTIRANLVEHDGQAYFTTTDGKLFRADPVARAVKEIPLSGVKK
jgi:outer membrane protein assembly factor BamB